MTNRHNQAKHSHIKLNKHQKENEIENLLTQLYSSNFLIGIHVLNLAIEMYANPPPKMKNSMWSSTVSEWLFEL